MCHFPQMSALVKTLSQLTVEFDSGGAISPIDLGRCMEGTSVAAHSFLCLLGQKTVYGVQQAARWPRAEPLAGLVPSSNVTANRCRLGIQRLP